MEARGIKDGLVDAKTRAALPTPKLSLRWYWIVHLNGPLPPCPTSLQWPQSGRESSFIPPDHMAPSHNLLSDHPLPPSTSHLFFASAVALLGWWPRPITDLGMAPHSKGRRNSWLKILKCEASSLFSRSSFFFFLWWFNLLFNVLNNDKLKILIISTTFTIHFSIAQCQF